MKYLKNTINFLIVESITLIILTLLYYFDITSSSVNKTLKIISYFLLFIYSGFTVGRNAKNKAYVEGLKLSLIFIFISLLFSIITKNTKINLIFYYIILTITITFSSMIGINFKKKR